MDYLVHSKCDVIGLEASYLCSFQSLPDSLPDSRVVPIQLHVAVVVRIFITHHPPR